jgi:hypothetical protein
MSQKIELFLTTAVRTANPTLFLLLVYLMEFSVAQIIPIVAHNRIISEFERMGNEALLD